MQVFAPQLSVARCLAASGTVVLFVAVCKYGVAGLFQRAIFQTTRAVVACNRVLGRSDARMRERGISLDFESFDTMMRFLRRISPPVTPEAVTAARMRKETDNYRVLVPPEQSSPLPFQPLTLILAVFGSERLCPRLMGLWYCTSMVAGLWRGALGATRALQVFSWLRRRLKDS
jgi:hypothetical protein